MAAKSVVIGTQCRECTEPMGKVVVVGVFQGYGPGATVKAGSGKDAVGKVVSKVGIFFEELPQGLGKVLVELWSICCKST